MQKSCFWKKVKAGASQPLSIGVKV